MRVPEYGADINLNNVFAGMETVYHIGHKNKNPYVTTSTYLMWIMSMCPTLDTGGAIQD